MNLGELARLDEETSALETAYNQGKAKRADLRSEEQRIKQRISETETLIQRAAEVMHFFKLAKQRSYFTTDTFETVEKGHGRIEQRICTCLDVAGQYFLHAT